MADATDHLVWLKPYSPKRYSPTSFADLPSPFLDVGRAQRLVPTSHGFEVWACANNTIRVIGTDPWLDDPHTPKVANADGVRRYKLAAKPFDHRFQHHVLFGNIGKTETIERPRILDLTDYRYARLSALGSEQGKTKGYREALFVAKRSEGLFHFELPRPEDRPTRLSQAALATIEIGSKILYAALAVLYPDADDLSDTEKKRIRAIQHFYYEAVTHPSIQFVFDMLNAPEDAAAEQSYLNRLIAEQIRTAFDRAATALARPLHAARAANRIESGIHFRLKGESMTKEFAPPPLARQSFAILRELSQHATPDDRARLRTMLISEHHCLSGKC